MAAKRSGKKQNAEGPEKSGPREAEDRRDEMMRWSLRQARDGNINQARGLYRDLAKDLMCRDGKDLTRLRRFVLARMLMRAWRGVPLEKAMLCEPKPGRQRWRTVERDFTIFGAMLQLTRPEGLVDDGEDQVAPKLAPAAAAKEVVDSGQFPGLSSKTILNIYLQMLKDPRIPE